MRKKKKKYNKKPFDGIATNMTENDRIINGKEKKDQI